MGLKSFFTLHSVSELYFPKLRQEDQSLTLYREEVKENGFDKILKKISLIFTALIAVVCAWHFTREVSFSCERFTDQPACELKVTHLFFFHSSKKFDGDSFSPVNRATQQVIKDSEDGDRCKNIILLKSGEAENIDSDCNNFAYDFNNFVSNPDQSNFSYTRKSELSYVEEMISFKGAGELIVFVLLAIPFLVITFFFKLNAYGVSSIRFDRKNRNIIITKVKGSKEKIVERTFNDLGHISLKSYTYGYDDEHFGYKVYFTRLIKDREAAFEIIYYDKAKAEKMKHILKQVVRSKVK